MPTTAIAPVASMRAPTIRPSTRPRPRLPRSKAAPRRWSSPRAWRGHRRASRRWRRAIMSWCRKVMYWSLRNWLLDFATQLGPRGRLRRRRPTDAVAAAVQAGRRPSWCGSRRRPIRPGAITDIAAAAEIAHRAGARLAVDSTVATPVLTRPIELGADIVMHSATKYLNGHSDVIAGALVGRARRRLLGTAARDPRAARHDPRPIRGVAAAARHAHAVPARRLGVPLGRGAGRAPGRPPDGGRGALSRPARLRRPCDWRASR